MHSYDSQDPFVVFTPQLGRFIAAEAWSATLSAGFAVALLYVLGTMRQAWLVGSLSVGLFSVVFAATFIQAAIASNRDR